MAFRDKERDRELQIELLKTQLDHERKVAFFSAVMAVSASFVIFALTMGLSIAISKEGLPASWILMIWAYLILGSILLLASMGFFFYLTISEKKVMERIRKKYLEW